MNKGESFGVLIGLCKIYYYIVPNMMTTVNALRNSTITTRISSIVANNTYMKEKQKEG